ncbi:MAG: phage minor head protein [Thiohalomonadaceae bacterium]
MKAEEILLLAKILRQTGNTGLSDFEIKQMYQRLGSDDFLQIAEDILKANPNISKYYQALMKDWEPNPLAKLSQYDQFSFSCRTSYYRAITMDTLDQYQAAGVKKVQIVAFMDDRTSDICRDMHGRVFDISDHHEEYGNSVFVPPREQMVSAVGRPTGDIGTILPPYHYNCRTVYVPYEEPKKEVDKIRDMIYNNESIGSDTIERALEEALKAKWGQNGSSLMRNYKKYGGGMEINEYQKLIVDNIRKAGRDIILGINQDSLNLHLFLVRRDVHSGSSPHLLSIIDLTNNTIITSFFCDDDFIINTTEQLLKAVPKTNWREIMKSKDAFFYRARLPEKAEVDVLIKVYEDLFFGSTSEDTTYNDNHDMYSRYSLYKADMMNYLSEEQRARMKAADKSYINNYGKGMYDRKQSNLNAEIDTFFDWLIRQGAVA